MKRWLLYMLGILGGIFLIFYLIIPLLKFTFPYVLNLFVFIVIIVIILGLFWLIGYETEAEKDRPSRKPFKWGAIFILSGFILFLIFQWILPSIKEKRSLLWPIYFQSKKDKHLENDLKSGVKKEPWTLDSKKQFYSLMIDLSKKQADYFENEIKNIKKRIKRNPEIPVIENDDLVNLQLDLQKINNRIKQLTDLINDDDKINKTKGQIFAGTSLCYDIKQQSTKWFNNQLKEIKKEIKDTYPVTGGIPPFLNENQKKFLEFSEKIEKEEIECMEKIMKAANVAEKDKNLENANKRKKLVKNFSEYIPDIHNLSRNEILLIIAIIIVIYIFISNLAKKDSKIIKIRNSIFISILVLAVLYYAYNNWGNKGQGINKGGWQKTVEKLLEKPPDWKVMAIKLPLNEWVDIRNTLPQEGCFDFNPLARNFINFETEYWVKYNNGEVKLYNDSKYTYRDKDIDKNENIFPTEFKRVKGNEFFIYSIIRKECKNLKVSNDENYD